MELWSALSWLDGSLLAVLLISVVIGLVRGFVFECLSLAGWLVAWFAAQWAAPVLAPHVPVGTAGSELNLGAAFALAFIGALVIWSLLSRLIRMLIHATPLSIPDRLLGAGFGVLRGGVLLLALASVVTLTPAAQSGPWRSSHGARWLGQALDVLKPLLPSTVTSLLPG
ncbi:MAG: CvpA family protein [Rubrivivax sp.]|nr:CvpA family protein [Rubrivivax sp.]